MNTAKLIKIRQSDGAQTYALGVPYWNDEWSEELDEIVARPVNYVTVYAKYNLTIALPTDQHGNITSLRETGQTRFESTATSPTTILNDMGYDVLESRGGLL